MKREAIGHGGRWRWAVGVAIVGVAARGAVVAGAGGVEPAPPAVTALREVLDSNLGECREQWKAGDFKTLKQTAEGISLVADALARRGSEAAWQAAGGKAIAAARSLAQAAGAANKTASGAAIEQLTGAAAAWRPLAPGKPAAGGGMPAAGLKPMMPLLDGTLAEAKRFVAVGEAEEARKRALALAELGRLVLDYRADAGWQGMALEFQQAAEAAAESEGDLPALRLALRGVQQRCDRCHDRR